MKKLLATILALVMTLTLVPAAWAETAGTALSLTDSEVFSYKDGVYTLQKDVEGTLTIETGEATLNLDGHRIYATTGDSEAVITVSSGAKLTIKDTGTTAGSVENENSGNSDSNSNNYCAVKNQGTLTIEGGTFTGGISTTGNEQGKMLTITGGTFNVDPKKYLAEGYKTEKDQTSSLYEVKRIYSTVTFNSVGGSAVATQSVEYEKTVDRPADPTRAGFEFTGWYTSDTDGTVNKAWDFGTYAVTKDVELYAQWTKTGTNVTGYKVEVLYKGEDNSKSKTKEIIYEKSVDTEITTVTIRYGNETVEQFMTTEVTTGGVKTTEKTTTSGRVTEQGTVEISDFNAEKTTVTEATMTTVFTQKSYHEQAGGADGMAIVRIGVNEDATVENTDVVLDATVATTVDPSELAMERIEVFKADADKLAKAKSVQVVTDLATLTIDKTALETLANSTGGNEKLVLTVTEFDRGANTVTYELEAVVCNTDSNADTEGKSVFKEASKNTNGTITVTVPWAAAPGLRQQLVCYYYADEDGSTRTRMGGAGYKNKTFSWDTNHFSKFVIETETVSASRPFINIGGSSSGTTTTTTTSKSSSAATFDAGIGVYAATAILSVTGMAWVGKKKH